MCAMCVAKRRSEAPHVASPATLTQSLVNPTPASSSKTSSRSSLTRERFAPPLPPDEESALMCRMLDGDRRAFDKVTRIYLRLVLTIVSEFRSRGVPYDDLVGEGMLAFVVAAKRFDPNAGARLSTYAAYWIRGYLRRYCAAHRRIVRNPSTRSARTILASFNRVERRLTSQFGAPPDNDALAREFGVEPMEIERARAILAAHDAAYGVRGSGGIFELASDQPTAEECCIDDQETTAVRMLAERGLSALSPRLRKVIEARHLREEPVALSQLGRELGVSTERVRQLQIQAEKQLRSSCSEFIA